jgi:hypothetical protein
MYAFALFIWTDPTGSIHPLCILQASQPHKLLLVLPAIKVHSENLQATYLKSHLFVTNVRNIQSFLVIQCLIGIIDLYKIYMK